MDINYIFGVTSKLINTTDTVKRGFILDSPQGNISTGTPCLIFSNTTNKRLRKILIPFPSSKNNPRTRLLIQKTNGTGIIVKTLNSTNFLDTIEIIKTPKIVIKDLDKTIQRVQDTGPVTFLINSSTNLNRDILKTLNILSKKFKVSAVLQSKRNGISELLEKEQVLLALTLIDIKCCIPIFNPKKVDGILLHTTVYYPIRTQEYDQLISLFETTLLFSKYTENLTKIDGTHLDFNLNSIETIKDVFRENSTYINEVGKKGTQKQKKISNDLSTTMPNAGAYVICSNTSSTSSSSIGYTDNF